MQQDMTIVEVVNRTTQPLNYLFDGVPGIVVPGYRVNAAGVVIPAGRDGQPATTPLTKTTAEYARRQNGKMGTEDAMSGEAEFLVGVAERDDLGTLQANPHWLYNDISYTEKSLASERFDRSLLEPRAQNATLMPSSGFPRGRSGSALEPLQYADGPVGPGRE